MKGKALPGLYTGCVFGLITGSAQLSSPDGISVIEEQQFQLDGQSGRLNVHGPGLLLMRVCEPPKCSSRSLLRCLRAREWLQPFRLSRRSQLRVNYMSMAMVIIILFITIIIMHTHSKWCEGGLIWRSWLEQRVLGPDSLTAALLIVWREDDLPDMGSSWSIENDLPNIS